MIWLAAAALAAEPTTDWRLDLVIATLAEVPVLGAMRAEGRSVLAVHLTRTAEGWIQEHEVCTSAVHEATRIVRTELPEAFVDALPDARFPATFDPKPGGGYAAAFGPQPVGWSGDGALPDSLTDPRVRDWEGDGRPAATVRVTAPFVGTGEVYVVQSGETRLTGTMGEDGVIRGSVSVVGYASRVLAATSKLLERGPEVTPDPGRSWFTLTPSPGFRCR